MVLFLLLGGMLSEKNRAANAVRDASPSLRTDSIEPISEVRGDANGDSVPDRLGDTVTVAGRSVVRRGKFVPVEIISLQDETAGIHVFLPERPTVERGDSVHVRGVVEHEYGLTQLRALDTEIIEAEPRVPKPLPLTVAAADGETYEGEFIRVRGRVIQVGSNQGGKFLILSDRSEKTAAQISVFVPNRYQAQLDRFEAGDEIAVTGVLGQHDYDEPYADFYQILPREPADLTQIGLTSTYLRTALFVLLGGGIIAVVAVVMLRSAVKRRTEQLAESRARFRRLAEATFEGIILHENGRIIDANEALAEMVGRDRETLVGQEVNTVLAESTRDLAEESLDGAGEEITEAEVVRKDGTTIPVEVETKEVTRDDCTLRVVALRDISKRKEREKEILLAKREAEKANQVKSAFLANISHEIRTPLTSVIGFAEIIGGKVEDLEEHLESSDLGAVGRFARLIEKSGRRLLETLDGVLNLSKLEAGEMELSRKPVNLAEEAREAAELFEQRAEEECIDLQVETNEDPAWARADEGGVQIVLRNLVSNALKYTGEGGHVWVRVRNAGGIAALEVEDTGIGMAPEEVSSLFEAFKQESEGLGREYEGTGLGLAVTKRVLNQMDGSIDVETEKGEGSTFVVNLPALSNGKGSEGEMPHEGE